MLVLLLAADRAMAQDAALVAQGRAQLINDQMAAANASFIAATNLAPTDPEAQTLAAITDILALWESPAAGNLAQQLGFTIGGGVKHGTAAPIPAGLAANFNLSQVQSFTLTSVLPQIQDADQRLAIALANNPGLISISTQESGTTMAVNLDQGDLLVLRALLQALISDLTLSKALNTNAVLQDLIDLAKDQMLDAQHLRHSYPQLFARPSGTANAGDLAAAQAAFAQAITLYNQASTYIRTQRSNAQPLFAIDPVDYPQETKFRQGLATAQAALAAPQPVGPSDKNVSLDLRPVFNGTADPVALMPKFSGSSVVVNSFPDPTFAGILVGSTQALVNDTLQPTGAVLSYTVTDLGTLPGGRRSEASGTNQAGQVVGDAWTANFNTHAFWWTTAGGMQDLGTLPDGTTSYAYALNNVGQIVGQSDTTGGVTHAVLWTVGGGAQDLGALPGGANSYAEGVNDFGQVVGYSDTGGGADHAFLWSAGGGIQDLGTLPGMTASYAYGINNSGQVVGYSHMDGGSDHAFLWTAADGMQDLGTLPGGSNSYAYAVSATGQVVGSGNSGPFGRAFSWTMGGGLLDLGSAPGGFYTEAYAVNTSGQIVGDDFSGAAFLYQNGIMSDLNKFVGRSGSNLRAYGINDVGQIVGRSDNNNGEQHAVQLSPITASSSWLVINVQPPQSLTIYAGQNAQFFMQASSASVPSYQWQRQPVGSLTWSNLSNDGTYSGVSTRQLNISGVIPAMSGDQFRNLVTTAGGSVTSTESQLTVINPAAITLNQAPQSPMTAVGQTATFAVFASSSPAPSFQWQESTDGGNTWNDLSDGGAYSGTQNATLEVSNTLLSQANDQFRCVASNGGVNPAVTSPPSTLKVYPVNSWNGWRLTTFDATTLNNPAVSGATATPANDGLSNFLKYAFNLNPFFAESGQLPQSTIVNGQIELTFTQLRSDVTYTVQASADLQTWSTQGVALVTNGNQVTASHAVPASGTEFLRIVLTYNGP